MSHYSASEWEAEWTAARTPKGAIVHIKVELADASRQGRALVAGCAPQPACSRPRRPSTCQLTRSQPLPAASQQPAGQVQSSARRPPASRQRAAEARSAATRAEDEERQAIDRFRPFIRVAAVSATPRPTSPDHFGLRRHLECGSGSNVPREDARDTMREKMTHRRH